MKMYQLCVTRNQLESVNCISSKKQTIVIICDVVECALQFSTVLMRIIWFRIKYKSTFHIHIIYIWIWVWNLNTILQYILSEDVIQETRISVEYVKESINGNVFFTECYIFIRKRKRTEKRLFTL